MTRTTADLRLSGRAGISAPAVQSRPPAEARTSRRSNIQKTSLCHLSPAGRKSTPGGPSNWPNMATNRAIGKLSRHNTGDIWINLSLDLLILRATSAPSVRRATNPVRLKPARLKMVTRVHRFEMSLAEVEAVLAANRGCLWTTTLLHRFVGFAEVGAVSVAAVRPVPWTGRRPNPIPLLPPLQPSHQADRRALPPYDAPASQMNRGTRLYVTATPMNWVPAGG